MNSEKLREIARTLFGLHHLQLEQTGNLGPPLAIWRPNPDSESGDLEHLPLPEGLAGALLNSSESKEALFAAVGKFAREWGAYATFFASEAWVATLRSPGGDIQGIREQGFPPGASKQQVLQLIAQSAAEMVIISQKFAKDNDGAVYFEGEAEERAFPSSQFTGRIKMLAPKEGVLQ